MEDTPSRQYGTDDLTSVLIENSELAYEDRLAIVAAINAQTVVLNQILVHLQTFPTQSLSQLNTSSPPVQSVQSVDKPMDTVIIPVVIDGQTYTSPKLMQVIKWLEVNPGRRNDTVREIAEVTGVSKSWVAIAKRYKAVQ